MTRPSHHPGDMLLIDYAGGGLCEGASLAVATHMAYCPACRHAVSEMEAVGGALLDELEPEPLSPGCLEALMARLDREGPRTERPAPSCRAAPFPPPRYPEPLRSYLRGRLAADGTLGAGGWRFIQPGMRGINLISEAAGTTRLVRMRGGVAVPRHTHGGIELTVVLEGGFSDEFGSFGPGDLAVGDCSLNHAPVSDPEGCLCLNATIGGLRLTGPVGRLLNRFIRF
ncbi:ChrR family anti-sigma-E factor [Azospirillum picis]|uniref:Transcriptional regulator n=1 Tax=Azospirillum picis TaxID=488438 RepID=A0ABU0MKE3_9PROT|nr:ChrR family anti-sigma-E factor [Azospirillum picis]MBP2300225.1 putative transcriptional regulator [Azospirillum picis]MDQ0533933.1 putative transcriptional regulator [Azospirillum picis]